VSGPTTPGGESSFDAARLTAGVRRGDRAAFATLYEAYFDRVLGLARSISGRDESFCLDAVQETMMRAIRAIRVAKDADALWAWFASATRSAVVDLVRKELRRKAHERAASERGTAATTTVDAELAAWVRERLAALGPDEERLLREHVVDGRSLAELARGDGTPGTTRDAVYGRIRRVIFGLRRKAKEAFGNE